MPLASHSPCPIIVYFVASYRPHLSHFWENVIFAIPTKSLSIYASTLVWTGGFVLLCSWFIEVVVSRTKCNARRLLHLINKNFLTFLAGTILTPYVIEFSYPKNPKMCDPILVTLLKMQPHYSQSSRENATPSSSTFPLASYKEVPSRERNKILSFVKTYHPALPNLENILRSK